MALHFTRRLTVALDPSSKVRSFAISKKSGSADSNLEMFVAMHANTICKYSVSTTKKNEEESKEDGGAVSLKQSFGQIECHRQGVRGVVVSANDQLFATNSFDSVKVWSVDLFMYQ